MDELLKLLLLFSAGSIAGFINVMAGGGSTITLPILILLGLDPSLANGTNRMGILAQTFSAVVSFRQEKYHDFKLSLKLTAFTLPGAIAGAVLATRISDVLFQRILAYVLIGVTISMFLRKTNQAKLGEHSSQKTSWLIYPVMVAIGFYGGFMQVGVGFAFMVSLFHLMRLDLIRVNMHKVFIIFIYTIPAFIVFLITGNVEWKFGLTLALGMAFGAWWAAKIAVKKGEKIIRIVLVVVILWMALKLLNLI
ncbi:MAG: sulfite exporter TauE/SafE family protein [Candidatus Aminicenantes bacterium]|nr:sulfite exporter TauE/SafE family protein [Candidatus Aminicenantes bacterium]